MKRVLRFALIGAALTTAYLAASSERVRARLRSMKERERVKTQPDRDEIDRFVGEGGAAVGTGAE